MQRLYSFDSVRLTSEHGAYSHALWNTCEWFLYNDYEMKFKKNQNMLLSSGFCHLSLSFVFGKSDDLLKQH